jgi:hypothetical protein
MSPTSCPVIPTENPSGLLIQDNRSDIIAGIDPIVKCVIARFAVKGFSTGGANRHGAGRGGARLFPYRERENGKPLPRHGSGRSR